MTTPVQTPEDSPVGVAVNGVLLYGEHTSPSNRSLGLSMVFDGCFGHVDPKGHRYHYHLIPKCLLESMGVPFPTNNTFWTAQSFAEIWEPIGPPSPILGWALDGFPVFGPYDAAGRLVQGHSHPQSPLDKCNGMTLPAGQTFTYGYFMTPDPPYTVACFKGAPVGGPSFSEVLLDNKVLSN